MIRGLMLTLLGAWCAGCAAQQARVDSGPGVDDAGAMDATSFDASENDSATTDAAINDDMAVAIDSGLPRCDWSSPPTIASIVQLSTVNSDFDETDAFVSADGLTIYFSSNRDGDHDVYSAQRSTPTGAFGSVAPVSWASSDRTEWRAELSADSLTAFLAADLAGSVGLTDIWAARRTTSTGAFPALGSVTAVNTAGSESDPHISADGLRLYFASDAPPGMAAGHFQILMSTRASSTASFGAPTLVGGLTEATTHNANATLNEDETVVVFASTRPSSYAGTIHIWYATRPNRDSAFSPPVEMPPQINDGSENHEPFITRDGCRIYFTSTRNAADDDDLLMATLAP